MKPFMHEEPELLNVAVTELGEGPTWDKDRQMLYWVDIVGKNLHMLEPESGVESVLCVGRLIGAAVVRESGGMMVALDNGLHALDLATGKLTLIVDPEADNGENRFNDGKCDAAGRFWAGTMSLHGKDNQGSLYCLGTDLSVRNMLSPVSISNGIGWSPDGTTMYYNDSPTRQVVAFDFDVETGALDNKRTVAAIPEGEGVPDGMTVDEEGMLWVAQWDGYRVSRWNPHTGERIGQVMLPVARVTSCIFAGAQMNELYITSASVGLSEEEMKNQPNAGGLYRVKMNVRGIPEHKFKG